MAESVPTHSMDPDTWAQVDRTADNFQYEQIRNEALRALLDPVARPLEDFLCDLETKLTRGHTPWKVYNWARTRGVDKPTVDKYIAIIRDTWKVEGMSYFSAQHRREEYRMMYREIYRESMDQLTTEGADIPKLLAVSMKTVEAMAKLDGMVGPDVVQVAGAVPISLDANGNTIGGNPHAHEITNATRERLQQLFAIMQARAETASAKATMAIVEARRQKGLPVLEVASETEEATPGQKAASK